MIHIIRKGNKRKSPIITFDCYNCNCKYSADDEEYWLKEEFMQSVKGKHFVKLKFFCKCPYCNRINYTEIKIERNS